MAFYGLWLYGSGFYRAFASRAHSLAESGGSVKATLRAALRALTLPCFRHCFIVGGGRGALLSEHERKLHDMQLSPNNDVIIEDNETFAHF